MLLITGGSRTSESGGQIFSEIFERLFRGVSENLFAFFPKSEKMFIYSPKISDDLFLFLVIDLFQVLIRNFLNFFRSPNP